MSKELIKSKKIKKKTEDNKDNKEQLNKEENKEEKFGKVEFFEKVNKYLQYDDVIKESMIEHRKEINELKSQKKNLELYLLDYLESVNNDIINVGESDKLVKVERQKKAPLNKEIIKCAIIDDLKERGIIKNEKEGEDTIERMFESMENKRAIKNIVQLKRKKIKK
jgi:hypothetical protein